MQGKLSLTLGLALAIVLAGCAEKQDGQMQDRDDADDGPPLGSNTDDGYTVTTSGVPPNADPGENFTFNVTVTGPAGRTDHVGAHYGVNVSATPTTSTYAFPCAHQKGALPASFTVTCRIDTPGTYHLRGHLRTGAANATKEWWGADTTVTVGPSAGGALGTLRVGTDAAFPPFEDLNTTTNEFDGFDMDLMREIGKRVGYAIEFQNLGFDPLIPALQNGQIDAAISAMSITDARSQQVDFTIAYYEANQSVAVRAQDDGTYSDLASMKGKGLKFGAQTGTVGADQVVAEFGEAALTRYDSYPLAIEALKRRDVDAVVMDQPAQKAAARTDEAIVVAFSFDVGDVYGIAVKKGSAVLVAQINAALTSMFADGTYDRLRDKWDV